MYRKSALATLPYLPAKGASGVNGFSVLRMVEYFQH